MIFNLAQSCEYIRQFGDNQQEKNSQDQMKMQHKKRINLSLQHDMIESAIKKIIEVSLSLKSFMQVNLLSIQSGAEPFQ